jgi:hypothetical protein
MSYGDNFQTKRFVINSVKDAVITYANSPSIAGRDEFSTTVRSWIIGQKFESVDNSVSNTSLYRSEFLLG